MKAKFLLCSCCLGFFCLSLFLPPLLFPSAPRRRTFTVRSCCFWRVGFLSSASPFIPLRAATPHFHCAFLLFATCFLLSSASPFIPLRATPLSVHLNIFAKKKISLGRGIVLGNSSGRRVELLPSSNSARCMWRRIPLHFAVSAFLAPFSARIGAKRKFGSSPSSLPLESLLRGCFV